MLKIHLGHQEQEFVSIQVLERESSDYGIADYWEINSLSTCIEVRAGSFHASVSCHLQVDDLVQCRDQLNDLLEWKENTADFMALEGWLRITFIMDERGRIELVGDLIDQPIDGNRLRFHLEIDQSFLPSILSDLDRAIEQNPVIGTPPLPQ
jgi:hypothetical protein